MKYLLGMILALVVVVGGFVMMVVGVRNGIVTKQEVVAEQ